MIPDYIAYVLTGNKRHEITNASTMGLLDSTTMKLSEEFLKKVFDPFERSENSTKSGVQGTGLGMAISKSLMDLM